MKSAGSTPLGTFKKPVSRRWMVNSTEFLAASASVPLWVFNDRLYSFPSYRKRMT